MSVSFNARGAGVPPGPFALSHDWINCNTGAALELRSCSTDCERVTDISAGKSRAAGNQSRLCHDRQFFDRPEAGPFAPRSGEHTSELQSRPYLVCRLLLGKKKSSKQAYAGAVTV